MLNRVIPLAALTLFLTLPVTAQIQIVITPGEGGHILPPPQPPKIIDGITIPPVPKKTVDEAIATPLIRFNRNIKGGAYTNGAWSGGTSIVLAFAAWEGDSSADKRILEQIRYTLNGDNVICCNGGYPSQHERHITGMLALVKLTPRVWDQLTADEHAAIDLIMKAALIGSAYTTSDISNSNGKSPTTLDGDDNCNRGWNPNYREGMIGAMIVGAVYFTPKEAEKILNSYDHDAFLAQLKTAGLTNIYETFNWKADHPDSKAPTAKELTDAIKDYRYLDSDLSDPLEIYYGLTKNTYGAKVNAGLNDGQGEKDAGKIATGADDLPNKGQPGMLLEFDSKDAGGSRSSITYAYDGFRPNLTHQAVLIAAGYWKKSEKTEELAKLMDVGITDLFYKLEHGYIDYSKGHADKEPFDIHAKHWSFAVSRSLWQDVLKPYHQALGELPK